MHWSTCCRAPTRGARRAALTLFETIAARSPAESAAALARVVTNEKVADDVRVAALLILRRAGAPAPTLRPVLERAMRPESSPRLRAAALPLYARLISPAEAEDLARTRDEGVAGGARGERGGLGQRWQRPAPTSR